MGDFVSPVASAADLLAAIDPGQQPWSVRETGVRPWRMATTRAAHGVSFGDNLDLTSEIVLLGARQAKAWSSTVLIADPAAILALQKNQW